MNMDGLMVERQAHREGTRCSLARAVCCLLLLGGLFSASGCAAFHPIRGVPARYLPDEYRAQSRAGKRTIDLSLLVRRAPDQYRVAAGDVLSVYVPACSAACRRIWKRRAKSRRFFLRCGTGISPRSDIRFASGMTTRSRCH